MYFGVCIVRGSKGETDMTYFQDEASVRYITHADDDINDDLSKLSGASGTVGASFHTTNNDADLSIYGTDGAAINLTIDQARHLVSVIMQIDAIHHANQKVK